MYPKLYEFVDLDYGSYDLCNIAYGVNQTSVVYCFWVNEQSRVPPGFWLMPKGKLI